MAKTVGGLRLVPANAESRDERRRRPKSSEPESRTPAQKDVDRLYYARSFLRLGAVTQVYTPDPLRPVAHNRLTHSLKVAQIARTIAGNLICAADQDSDLHSLIVDLGGLDASVAEAAGLAHDLGHPPFGHAGERVLDEFSRHAESPIQVTDGFEGNAQSFRFAVKSELMYPGFGLNLTAATNTAILKYPWSRPTPQLPVPVSTDPDQAKLRKKKFSCYYSESTEFQEVRAWLPSAFLDSDNPRQSLEASIMDIADDITYAVHDYEDFIGMGMLSPELLAADLHELLQTQSEDPSNAQRPAVGALISHMKEYAWFDFEILKEVALSHVSHLPSLRARGFGRDFRNNLLDELLSPESVQVSATPLGAVGAHATLNPSAWHLVEMLKFFVKRYVINSSELALLQTGQGSLLRKGIRMLIQWNETDYERLPAELTERLSRSAQSGETLSRAYLDYVCSLGDLQFEAVTLAMSGERSLGLTNRPNLG